MHYALLLFYGLSTTGLAADAISTAGNLHRGWPERNLVLGPHPSTARFVAYNIVSEGLNAAVWKLPKVPRLLVWGVVATVEYRLAIQNIRSR